MGREIDILDIDIIFVLLPAAFPCHEEIIFIYTLTCRGGKLEAELQVKAGTKVSCSERLHTLHTPLIDAPVITKEGTRKHLLFPVG